MVNDKRYFIELEDIDNVNISVAKKNESITAKQQGNISIKTFYGDDTSAKTMKNVLFVKDLKCNLMSIRSLTKRGYCIIFEGDYAYASINNETKFVAHTSGKLYEVIFHVDRDVFVGISDKKSLHQNLWHYHLGHLNTCEKVGESSNGQWLR